MALSKTIQCPECDRKFSMPGHLARHLASIHGTSKKRKTKTASKRGRKPGRPPGSKSARKAIRKMPGKHHLGSMSLDQLSELISSAREAARKQLKKLRSVFR